MTHTIQRLVALLERLPAAEQEKYGARWLGELLEGQGDGGRAPDTSDQEPVSIDPKRPLGLAVGKVHVPESFFDPLPEDELALWNGEVPSNRP